MTPTRRGFLTGFGAGLCAAVASGVAADQPEVASAASLARDMLPATDAGGLLMAGPDGTTRTLAEWRGGVVLLNLWGPWCVPCRREMPSLARLAARSQDSGLTVLPLAFDWRGAASVRRFYTETGISGLPVLIGDGDNLKEVLGIELLPSTLVIGPDSQTRAIVSGEAQWDDPATYDWLMRYL